jgi:hypothetical protein
MKNRLRIFPHLLTTGVWFFSFGKADCISLIEPVVFGFGNDIPINKFLYKYERKGE